MLRNRLTRSIAAVITASLLFQIVAPTVALALADGPSQAEFFGSPGGGSMVNPFTGAFSYSIPVLSVPGPNGVGYGMTLNYNNDLSPESEASWVGHGWSLNAGAVNRIKRGYPDDYKNADVKQLRNMRPNHTVQGQLRGELEILSKELQPKEIRKLIEDAENAVPPEKIDPDNVLIKPKLKSSFAIKYNNYTGYDYLYDLSGNGLGLSAGASFSENGVEFDADFKPLTFLVEAAVSMVGTTNFWTQGLGAPLLNVARAQPGVKYLTGGNEFHPPSKTSQFSGWSVTFDGAIEMDGLPNTGVESGITGSWSRIGSVFETHDYAYGYLYSQAVQSNGSSMDYYTEKEDHYNDKDRRLPLPFSNADYFSVSGAGVGGTFRAHHRGQGHFRPAEAKSTIRVNHANFDLHVGGGVGAGSAVGGGSVVTWIKGWLQNGLSFTNNPDDGEGAFFRFRGDQGGAILDASDDAVQMDVENTSAWAGGQSVWPFINNGARTGRSAYVGYNTNGDVLSRPPFGCFDDGGPALYKSFSRRSSVVDDPVNRTDPSIKDGIGEFSIVRGDGMTYVYGLPVYARGETQVNYGLYGLAGENIENNFLAYTHLDTFQYRSNDNFSKTESATPYATTFLLTEVVSPDYVDRTNNGPTPDDLGGYVIFNYTRTSGDKDKTGSSLDDWYKWRTPYRGTYYSRNSFSDPYDDAGSFSYGYKEIYYLESIETKTHKAIFRTSDREDGYEAHHNEEIAGADDEATTVGVAGAEKLQKLDRIELWSKNAEGNTAEHLSTTFFDYDYSLCRGLPNAEDNGGKLTLKKVWFEYEGVVSARISPYEFFYDYKDSDYFRTNFVPLTEVGEQYAGIVEFADALKAEATGGFDPENPDYSPLDIDPWGNYQHDGASRHTVYRPWVDQTPDPAFDPAAWQLKRIKLPSGGEIHVQYEQNEYRYVGHRPAMVMVPLLGREGTDGDAQYSYELDLSELGITTAEERSRLVTALKKQFGDKDGGFAPAKDKEFIYFRFLYEIVDDTPDEADPNSCNSEYLSGYAPVWNVAESADKVYVRIGESSDDKQVPNRICKDFYKAARQGIVEADCGQQPIYALDLGDGNIVETLSKVLYSLVQTVFGVIDEVAFQDECKDINYSHSYLRIPAIDAKKGGGVRVKRILTYDPGIDLGEDRMLFGSEYFYQTPDGQSSGVATTEPTTIREENSLVHLGISARAGNDTIVFGKGMRQLEEPLGESLYPAASVGYSRVVVRNIYQGKSAPGFTEYQYYTSRDYPFDLRHSNMSHDELAALGTQVTPLATKRREPYPLDVAVYGKSKIEMTATQGYRFILFNMHGQAKGVAKYVGSYEEDLLDGETELSSDLTNATMTEQVTYEYYQPWESIPMMNGPSVDDITYAYPGKTMELATESRFMNTDMSDVNLQLDAEAWLGFLFPMPFASIAGRYQVDEQILQTHVTTKVIEYPVILKSISAIKDGITDRTDYAGFDPESGAALLVKKYDGHDSLLINGATEPHSGAYYAVDIPAWRHFPSFGQMAKYQDRVLRSDDPEIDFDGNGGVAFDKRFLKKTGGEEHYLILRSVTPWATSSLKDLLVTGDLIEIFLPKVNGGADGYERDADNHVQYRTKLGVYHVGNVGSGGIQLLPTSYSLSNNYQEIRNVWIRIVKSGRTNRIGASAGGFTTYGMPPQGTAHSIPQ